MTRTTRSSSKKTIEKVAHKLSIKKSNKGADKSKAKKTTKTPVTAKKETVKPKFCATTTKKLKLMNKDLVPNLLELCLLLDCTGSMASWIQRSKDTLKSIIESVKAENQGLKVRVCFIGYRDV